MINQLRADYYKLFHSRLFRIIIAAFIISFIVFTAMAFSGNVFSMGAVQGYKNGTPLIDGFRGFVYMHPDRTYFWELCYSATAFNGLLWFILMALSVQFISTEYQTGTIKLAAAYGINMFKVYISKNIVVVSFYGLILCIFNLAAFAVVSYTKHYMPTFGNITLLFELIFLHFLAAVVFSLICFTLYIAVKNTIAISTIMPVFMFSIVGIDMIYGFKPTFLADCYLRINPFYYMSSASRFWADPLIVRNILLYFVTSVPILLISSYFILRKQEIK